MKNTITKTPSHVSSFQCMNYSISFSSNLKSWSAIYTFVFLHSLRIQRIILEWFKGKKWTSYDFCFVSSHHQPTLSILQTFIYNIINWLLSLKESSSTLEILKKYRIFFNPLLPNGNYGYRIIKISFLKKKGSWKKIPMSAASMSR